MTVSIILSLLSSKYSFIFSRPQPRRVGIAVRGRLSGVSMPAAEAAVAAVSAVVSRYCCCDDILLTAASSAQVSTRLMSVCDISTLYSSRPV